MRCCAACPHSWQCKRSGFCMILAWPRWWYQWKQYAPTASAWPVKSHPHPHHPPHPHSGPCVCVVHGRMVHISNPDLLPNCRQSWRLSRIFLISRPCGLNTWHPAPALIIGNHKNQMDSISARNHNHSNMHLPEQNIAIQLHHVLNDKESGYISNFVQLASSLVPEDSWVFDSIRRFPPSAACQRSLGRCRWMQCVGTPGFWKSPGSTGQLTRTYVATKSECINIIYIYSRNALEEINMERNPRNHWVSQIHGPKTIKNSRQLSKSAREKTEPSVRRTLSSNSGVEPKTS